MALVIHGRRITARAAIAAIADMCSGRVDDTRLSRWALAVDRITDSDTGIGAMIIGRADIAARAIIRPIADMIGDQSDIARLALRAGSTCFMMRWRACGMAGFTCHGHDIAASAIIRSIAYMFGLGGTATN
jgi:hypothetical protein